MSLLDPITHPLPLDPLPENKLEDRRLWIGNLDPRITEYHLLKLLQKYGHIEKFDLLFHRSGPLAGQPRGYAFVTYSTSEDANKAKEKLDGTMLGYKHVVVRWANSVGKDGLDKPKPELEIPALAGAKCEKKISRQTTIQAIEAKLKLMEHSAVGEFEVNNPPSGSLHSQERSSVLRPTVSRQKLRGRHESRPYKKSNSHKR
ncbi:probable RNA-binding protein 18 [Anabrus simplex]|uniref:probable RNA-binding protein 18 n=1 Tax=Anabrus simplex TaxID=316456 RepID=UPI0034DCCAA3